MFGETDRTEVDVRIFTGDIRVSVMTNVVSVAPRGLVDGNLPVKRGGVKSRLFAETVVSTVQSGVSDFGRFELLMNEEREYADRESNRLEAEMNHRAGSDFHRA